MSHERKSRSLRQRAFTLVELLVVIAIIGLLATIVGVNVLKSMKKARQTKARADIKGISDACDMFKIDNARYPERIEDLISPPPDVTDWDEPYLKDGTLPIDPWGRPYVYVLEGTGYTITSFGADGAPGGEGENLDIDNHGDQMGPQ